MPFAMGLIPEAPSAKLCATCGDGWQLGDQRQRQVMCSRTATGYVLRFRNLYVQVKTPVLTSRLLFLRPSIVCIVKGRARAAKDGEVGECCIGVLFAPTFWQFWIELRALPPWPRGPFYIVGVVVSNVAHLFPDIIARRWQLVCGVGHTTPLGVVHREVTMDVSIERIEYAITFVECDKSYSN